MSHVKSVAIVIATASMLTLVAALTTVALAAPSGIVSKVTGTKLAVTGTSKANTITISCSGPGRVLVNGARPTTGLLACTSMTMLTVNGGSGNDFIDASAVNTGAFPAFVSSALNGGKGNDEITGTFLADTIFGQVGNDSLNALPGNDTLDGGPGSDILTDQASTVVNLSNTSISSSGGGLDLLTSMDQAQIVLGGAASVNGATFSGRMHVTGSAGADTLVTGGGDDVVYGAAGIDTITSNGGEDYLSGGLQNDTLNGGSDDDTVYEASTLLLTLTPTTLNGTTTGTDTLTSIEKGRLAITTGGGGATAATFTGPVEFFGSPFTDFMTGGSGADTFYPGDGLATIAGNGSRDVINVTASDFLATPVAASVDGDSVAFTTIEAIVVGGTAGPDTLDASQTGIQVYLNGLAGNDVLIGGSSADTLNGGAGKDTLTGNAGDDALNGGKGTDACTGGLGADTLVSCP